MDLDIAAFNQATWERYSYMATGCLIFYEYLLQFGNEVDLFWKKRWCVGKGLFLWSRYFGLAYSVANTVVFLQPKPSFDMFVFSSLTEAQSKVKCTGAKFFRWQNTGAVLQTLTTQFILAARLYAMYGNRRGILMFLVFLLLAEAAAVGVIFGIPNQKLIATNEPFPGLLICADGDPLDGSHWIVWVWTAALVVESSFLVMSLYIAWTRYRDGTGSKLMRNLTRDSVVYFVLIFGNYLVNTILWVINRLTLNELWASYSYVVSSVLANRLLITVRLNYYNTEPDGTEILITDSTRPELRTFRAAAKRTVADGMEMDERYIDARLGGF